MTRLAAMLKREAEMLKDCISLICFVPLFVACMVLIAVYIVGDWFISIWRKGYCAFWLWLAKLCFNDRELGR